MYVLHYVTYSAVMFPPFRSSRRPLTDIFPFRFRSLTQLTFRKRRLSVYGFTVHCLRKHTATPLRNEPVGKQWLFIMRTTRNTYSLYALWRKQRFLMFNFNITSSFLKDEIRIMPSPRCLCVYVSPLINFWMPQPVLWDLVCISWHLSRSRRRIS
jgi:hypothetical protein